MRTIAAIAAALAFVFITGMLQAKDEYLMADCRMPAEKERLIITLQHGSPNCEYHPIIAYGMAQ